MKTIDVTCFVATDLYRHDVLRIDQREGAYPYFWPVDKDKAVALLDERIRLRQSMKKARLRIGKVSAS